MGILHSLSQIRSNSSNFQQWEKEQELYDEKRKAFGEKNPPSKQQIEEAKKYGETIMDVVDIMDQHSEDIAENVETATALPLGIIPMAALFGTSTLVGKHLNSVSKKLTDEKTKFINENKKQIDKIISEVNSTLKKQDTRYEDVISEKNVKKLKISTPLKTEAQKLAEQWTKISKPYSKKFWLPAALPFIAWAATFIGGSVYTTKLQIDSSKIARFQARKVLENSKYFVQYTPEQIEEAKQNLQNNKGKKTKSNRDKLKGGMFKGLFNILKDRKDYRKWKANDKDESKKVTRELTPEELIQAQKDQEVLQRVIKKINNNAENYSEKMEMAAGVIMGGTPFLGAFVGYVIQKIMTVTKILPNMVQKMVNKNGDKNVIKAYEEFSKIGDKQSGKTVAWIKFAEAIKDSDAAKKVENLKGFAGFYSKAKLHIPSMLSHSLGKKALFAGVSAFITTIAGTLIGMKLQKEAARVGRYEAKKELEQDPKNFIGYTPEELKNIEVKGTQTKSSKIKEYALFIPTVLKQYFDYQKHKKEHMKQEKELQEELVKIDVSDKQIKDAKNLQRKLFNTFEKVDDKSQQYSEHTEAAIEIAQPFVLMGGLLLAFAPFIAYGIAAATGKLKPKKVFEHITSILSRFSSIMKKKFFKNYLNEVSDQISVNVAKTKVDKKPLKDVFGKVNEGFDEISKEFDPKTKAQILEGIEKLKSVDVGKQLKEKVLPAINLIVKSMDDKTIKAATKELSENISNIKFLQNLEIETIDKPYIQKMLPKVTNVVENIPHTEIQNIVNTIIKESKEHPDELMELVKSGNIKSILMTPGLKKALYIAGISWSAFSIIMLYIIQSYLSEIQLKAGRLGVMKALEELKDSAYYANIEPVNNIQENAA